MVEIHSIDSFTIITMGCLLNILLSVQKYTAPKKMSKTNELSRTHFHPSFLTEWSFETTSPHTSVFLGEADPTPTRGGGRAGLRVIPLPLLIAGCGVNV